MFCVSLSSEWPISYLPDFFSPFVPCCLWQPSVGNVTGATKQESNQVCEAGVVNCPLMLMHFFIAGHSDFSILRAIHFVKRSLCSFTDRITDASEKHIHLIVL